MVKQKTFSLLVVLVAWGIAILTLLTNVWHSNSYFVFLITNAITIGIALFSLGLVIRELKVRKKKVSIIPQLVSCILSILLIGLVSLWIHLVESGV